MIFCLALCAQQFEVASVKSSAPDARGSTFNFTTGGGLTIKNGTLKGMIESAYEVRDFQIEGGPGWVNSDRYDIFAKSEYGEAPAGRLTPEQVRPVRVKLQALLAERFQLKVHKETKELPVYALTIAKGGLKMAEAPSTPVDGPAGIQGECGKLTGTRTTIDNLVVVLSRTVGRPVQDHTGLTARYNFEVLYTPDNGPCREDAPDRQEIFGALQTQLGLKLEATKGPVEIVVIRPGGEAGQEISVAPRLQPALPSQQRLCRPQLKQPQRRQAWATPPAWKSSTCAIRSRRPVDLDAVEQLMQRHGLSDALLK